MDELPQEAIEKLARVTKLLRTQRTLPAKLETVVALAKETVPNCDAAGVAVYRAHRNLARGPVPSHPAVRVRGRCVGHQ